MSAPSPDLPEPEWWAGAKALAATGLSAYKVALALGRDARSVRYAINPEYRRRHQEQAKAYRLVHKRPPSTRDKGREYLRREARARWRREGRRRSLFDYYREAQCL